MRDLGARFEKALSEEEIAWRDEAAQHKAELLARWAQVFRSYRQDSARPPPADDDQAIQAHADRLQALRDELTSLSKLRERFHQQETAHRPGMQHHGRVWLFLRKARHSVSDAD